VTSDVIFSLGYNGDETLNLGESTTTAVSSKGTAGIYGTFVDITRGKETLHVCWPFKVLNYQCPLSSCSYATPVWNIPFNPVATNMPFVNSRVGPYVVECTETPSTEKRVVVDVEEDGKSREEDVVGEGNAGVEV
jgi:hypothetical protein